MIFCFAVSLGIVFLVHCILMLVRYLLCCLFILYFVALSYDVELFYYILKHQQNKHWNCNKVYNERATQCIMKWKRDVH